ncbi:MAG: RraA family protein [Phototrophicaceae bacterium]|jgi:regulator of RNase E activity RraA
MALWQNDDELFHLMKTELFSAVIGDVLDKMGLLHQFLPPHIKALQDDMIVAGRAMTVLQADYFRERAATGQSLSNKPFGLMFEALDDLKPNEVYVAAGASPRFAMWGEMMSTRATHLKAAGAVVDGYSRDTKGILRLGFPTFSYGRFAQDQGARGKVVDWRVPVEIGQVSIQSGDIVFGDLDGIVIVPQAHVEETITRALEKARTENLVRKAIENGMSTVEAFAQFGVM